MKVCGPKYALCGLVLSVWGIVQLVFMGVFFYIRSVALVEDLPLEELKENLTSTGEFYKVVDRGYTQNAYNCWIAACIYVLTFLFSGHQFYLNSRSSLSV
ncbi:Ribonuclease kappa [Trachymyrmex septentrionalis]|uniref:Ribonuclease kappa n=1 Tax=Trachymyrmex septentrionalis TaxID=34720 RepID=A0A151JVL1_9HYME|nr:PREDICTED: ribonuclease kappa [Trachymyrmex septentrionalis]KYN37494.1 Ribonuclease kappa [Trachymyrmex septentrionalis]